MKIVSIMPIKLNNERCPGKNTKLLGDTPLLCHMLNTIMRMNSIQDVYVYCSDKSICEFLPSGASFLQRPSELDSPSVGFTQIFDAFRREIPADIYVWALATTPFVTLDTANECVAAVSGGEYDSALCAQRIGHFLWKDGQPLNFDPTNLPRTQDLPLVWLEGGSFYVFNRIIFEKYRRRVGPNPYFKEVSLREAVDINTEEDFRLAEALLHW